jgi:hypothetical protein
MRQKSDGAMVHCRSKRILCDFYGNVLIPPTVVAHTRAGLDAAVPKSDKHWRPMLCTTAWWRWNRAPFFVFRFFCSAKGKKEVYSSLCRWAVFFRE